MASLTRKRSSKNRVPSGKGNSYVKSYNRNRQSSQHHTRPNVEKVRTHVTKFDTKFMCPHILKGEGCPNKKDCKLGHTPEECVKLKWNDEIKSFEKILKKLDKIKEPNPKIVGQKAEIEAT